MWKKQQWSKILEKKSLPYTETDYNISVIFIDKVSNLYVVSKK